MNRIPAGQVVLARWCGERLDAASVCGPDTPIEPKVVFNGLGGLYNSPELASDLDTYFGGAAPLVDYSTWNAGGLLAARTSILMGAGTPADTSLSSTRTLLLDAAHFVNPPAPFVLNGVLVEVPFAADRNWTGQSVVVEGPGIQPTFPLVGGFETLGTTLEGALIKLEVGGHTLEPTPFTGFTGTFAGPLFGPRDTVAINNTVPWNPGTVSPGDSLIVTLCQQDWLNPPVVDPDPAEGLPDVVYGPMRITLFGN